MRTCACVRVLGSKSQCGCLPIIMMLLNPLALKLTSLSSLSSLSSSLLYPPPHFLNTQLTLPPSSTTNLSTPHARPDRVPPTPTPNPICTRCIISAYSSLLPLQRPLAEISSGEASLPSLSLSLTLFYYFLFPFSFFSRLAVAATLAE